MHVCRHLLHIAPLNSERCSLHEFLNPTTQPLLSRLAGGHPIAVCMREAAWIWMSFLSEMLPLELMHGSFGIALMGGRGAQGLLGLCGLQLVFWGRINLQKECVGYVFPLWCYVAFRLEALVQAHSSRESACVLGAMLSRASDRGFRK